MPDPREDRLPAWARARVAALRAENAALRAAADPKGPTPVRGVDRARNIVTPIPSGLVRFDVTPPTHVTPDDEVVTLRRQDGWIEAQRTAREHTGAAAGVILNGASDLAVAPIAANSVYVYLTSSARLPGPALAAWRGEPWPPEVTA